MNEIKYEIVEELGVLAETSKGWRTELNLVSWNGREAKYDLRDWSENHEKIGKGMALSKDELIKLREIINKLDLD